MVARILRYLGLLAVIGTCVTSSVALTASKLDIAASASAATSVKSCHGSQLVGAFVRTGIWGGNLDSLILFTNISNSVCRIWGYPRLVGLRDGQQYRLHVTSHEVLASGLAPAVLKPRMSGALIIGTGDTCPVLNQTNGAAARAHRYDGLDVVLPKDGGTITVFGVTLDTTCYLSETQLGWQNPFPMMLT
jgi:hypothetical protein